MTGETHDTRRILRLTGPDREHFLQNLVTNDITQPGLVYTALLTPQGKFICDFFVLDTGEAMLIDVDREAAPDLVRRLTLYKLRAKVEIEETGLHAVRGLGTPPEDGHPDPRHPSLGWRAYRETPADPAPDATPIDWDAIRVAETIPEAPSELGPDSYILEAGFGRLSGVDFRKGCYVGQEVTARMKHKTELRKGFVTVEVEGEAEPGTEIMNADGKPVGRLHTRSGDRALAYLRFDRAKAPLTAGSARVTWTP